MSVSTQFVTALIVKNFSAMMYQNLSGYL